MHWVSSRSRLPPLLSTIAVGKHRAIARRKKVNIVASWFRLRRRNILRTCVGYLCMMRPWVLNVLVVATSCSVSWLRMHARRFPMTCVYVMLLVCFTYATMRSSLVRNIVFWAGMLSRSSAASSASRSARAFPSDQKSVLSVCAFTKFYFLSILVPYSMPPV